MPKPDEPATSTAQCEPTAADSTSGGGDHALAVASASAMVSVCDLRMWQGRLAGLKG